MKKAALILACLLMFGFLPITNSASTVPQIQIQDLSNLPVYRVLRVVDGDTLTATNGSDEIKIRLIGVDTPETVHPRKPVEEYGIEASRFLKNLLKGESVHLKITSKDKYGRTLAYVFRYPDGLFVNAEIIRQGYGHAYTNYPFEYMEQFRGLEQFARQAEKGLWSSQVGEAANSAPANSQKATETVYVTRTGTKYHRPSCSHLRKSNIPIKLQKVIEQGYKPCGSCYIGG